ncbi:sensor histidine kinase [Alkalibacter mobilis]|uniref:sensor histidine kinase n=1 Tax=Alkalibacter mobilis TaxID=2787712 RepID=UPI0018A024D0|nr:HAMP domain-containing sensor histidine kinase [Alkalibacter mobilis]MBF7096606.1 HAMP domain-containing histidine kinase [Alkalibacter mobilis]
MFKELYRRLTLMNALILIAFLLIFSYSIVGFTNSTFDSSAKRSLFEQSEKIKNIVDTYGTFDFTLPNEGIGSGIDIENSYSRIEYILWNENLDLVNLSNLRENLLDVTFIQAKNALENRNSYYSSMTLSGVKYRIYNVYALTKSGSPYIIQVFQSRVIDDLITRQIFVVVMGIGIVSLIVLIFISAHLAKKSLEPVRQTYERQKEFIADASHELRTPLTIIRTSAELLTMKEDEKIKDNLKWIDNISVETENMSKLIENLLTLAQADNKQIPVEMARVDLSKLAYEAGEKFQLIAKEKGLELESIISDNVNIYGDKDKLNQLIVILLDNGIKYTPKSGKITLSLMNTAEKAIISVKDTGIGMTEEDRERIFERFYRVDKARFREEGGAGLGLSIAKWIVDEHKGKISVESQLNEGSNFIVELPKKRKI